MTVAQKRPASASRSQNKARLHNRCDTAVSRTAGKAAVRRQGGADVADKHGVLTGSIVAQHLSRQDRRTPVVILHTALFNTKTLYILHTEDTSVACMDFRTNSDTQGVPGGTCQTWGGFSLC